jgi:predicted metalloprotease
MPRSRYYDDDDDDRDYRRRRRPKSSNQSLILILGLGGCLLCICLIVCGGLFYLGMQKFSGTMQTAMAQAQQQMQDQEDAEAAAETFMQDVAANRLNEAYARTTKEFQTRLKFPQFRDFVTKNPTLKNYAPQTLDESTFSPKMAIYNGTVFAQNGAQLSFTLQLAKEGTAWRIDRFTIP